MDNPLIPKQNKVSYMMNGLIPAARVNYSSPTPSSASAPQTDPYRISEAVKSNETGGVRDPYSFKQSSGDPRMGMANGAYQVTDSELRTYAPKYLGRKVSADEFMSDPKLQDAYMNVKATALATRGLTPEQILAVHRGGSSDLTPEALEAMVKKYQPYVSKGMDYYSNTDKKKSTPSRTFAELTGGTM